ncbi:MAG: DUF721 domain-containing protein [Microthrixaceae bacterium]|nr:DUF721 domain-containing protein [Microthrixaceae bacterium]
MTDDEREPVSLYASLMGLQRYLGTATPSSLMALADSWEQVVGTRLARYCGIHSINRGTLVLQTAEPAVAEQLGWLATDLRDAANTVVGSADIVAVEVRIIPGWDSTPAGPEGPIG